MGRRTCIVRPWPFGYIAAVRRNLALHKLHAQAEKNRGQSPSPQTQWYVLKSGSMKHWSYFPWSAVEIHRNFLPIGVPVSSLRQLQTHTRRNNIYVFRIIKCALLPIQWQKCSSLQAYRRASIFPLSAQKGKPPLLLHPPSSPLFISGCQIRSTVLNCRSNNIFIMNEDFGSSRNYISTPFRPPLDGRLTGSQARDMKATFKSSMHKSKFRATPP